MAAGRLQVVLQKKNPLGIHCKITEMSLEARVEFSGFGS